MWVVIALLFHAHSKARLSKGQEEGLGLKRLFHESCFSGIKICTLSFWEGRIKILLETEV